MSNRNITRSDGKLSQKSILQATLNVILKDGIRNVKYKTVSETAGVTQSSVAYYFSSIPDLIDKSFRFYFEKYTIEMAHTRQIGEYVLAHFYGKNLQDLAVKKSFVIFYTETLMALLGSNTEELKEYLLLDRIFRNETLCNKALYKILKQQDQYDIDAIFQLFLALNTKSPEEESVQFMSLLWFIAERLLQEEYSLEEKKKSEQLIKHMLETIILN